MSPVKTLGKAIIFAVLGAALGFFLGTFLGIVSIMITGMVRHADLDLTIAYRIVGLSTGAMGFFGGFLFAIIRDLRRQ